MPKAKAMGKRDLAILLSVVGAITLIVVLWIVRDDPRPVPPEPPQPLDPAIQCLQLMLQQSQEIANDDKATLKGAIGKLVSGALRLENHDLMRAHFRELDGATLIALAKRCPDASPSFKADVRVLAGKDGIAGVTLTVGNAECETTADGRCRSPMTVSRLACGYDRCPISLLHGELLPAADAPSSATVDELEAGLVLHMIEPVRVELTLLNGKERVRRALVTVGARPLEGVPESGAGAPVVLNAECQTEKKRGAKCREAFTGVDGRVAFSYTGSIAALWFSIDTSEGAPVVHEVLAAALARPITIDLAKPAPVARESSAAPNPAVKPCASAADLTQALAGVLQSATGKRTVRASALRAGQWQHVSGLSEGEAAQLTTKTFPAAAACDEKTWTVSYP